MLRSAFLLFFCILCMHGYAHGAGTVADNNLLLDKEIKNLQAAYAAWQSNDAEFRELREKNQSAETDIQEFAGFVAALKRQVLEGCEAVRKLGGDGNQHGVDCIKLTEKPESKTGSDVKIPERAVTGEEKKNELEQELETLIGDFDELLLKEQGELKEQASTRQSNGGEAGSGTRGATEGSEAARSEGSAEEAAAGEPGDGQVPPKAEPGSGPGMQKQGDMPEFERGDLGDGSDDDVVARQLREAAEAERDPVLKAQLWEEYKKYKNSTR